jgi:hypothetical protein
MQAASVVPSLSVPLAVFAIDLALKLAFSSTFYQHIMPLSFAWGHITRAFMVTPRSTYISRVGVRQPLMWRVNPATRSRRVIMEMVGCRGATRVVVVARVVVIWPWTCSGVGEVVWIGMGTSS